ncbi:MAG: hypothetical protein LKJ86_03615 [Oscillibacter sp.]|jgi:hypothetical protein|nr:hypothetical protein [Oscillibacter sp.]
MELTGTYTAQGLALLAQATAGGSVTITRVMAGAGATENAANAVEFSNQMQALALLPATVDATAATATFSAVLTAALAKSNYALTELGVFAKGADGAEVLFCVYALDAPVTVSPNSTTVLRFLLSYTVTSLKSLTVTPSPAGLATVADVLAERALLPNRNLLDNWDFRNPVNQRSQSTYTGNGYTIDRLKIEDSGNCATLSVNDDGTITFSVPDESTADQAWLTQYCEHPFDGQLYTVSTHVVSTTGTQGMVISGEENELQTPLIPGICAASGTPSGTLAIRFVVPRGGSVTLRTMKLERGSVSTLANDPPANFAETLAKCQRYYFVHQGWLYLYKMGSQDNQTASLQFPVTMRTAPSVILTNGTNLNQITTDTTANGIMVYKNGDISTYLGILSFAATADL